MLQLLPRATRALRPMAIASFQRPLSASVPQKKISLTDSCVQRIVQLNKHTGQERMLRVSVEPGGCSGFQYAFVLEEQTQIEDDDAVIEQAGAKLVVDESSLELLQGAKIDFQDDMMRSAFVVVENPQSEAACGCGSSFQVKI